MSSGQWDGLSVRELTAIARELRRLADEVAREARARRQAEREAWEEARREIWAEYRANEASR